MIKKLRTRGIAFLLLTLISLPVIAEDSLKLAANESEEAQKQPAATALLDKNSDATIQNQNGTQKKKGPKQKKVSTRCHCPCDSH